jgi:TPR repeat protein
LNCITTPGWSRYLLAIALGAALTTQASATALSAHPIVIAVRHGDCNAAVKLLNPTVASNDDQTAFLAGRMLDEGICLKEDPAAATGFYARAAELGDKSAALDYASKVGLGEGTEQSYERAGELCRVTGIDPQSHLSPYALGYVCTLDSVAAELLRQALPIGAFQGSPAAVALEFNLANAEMHIRATPNIRLGDAPLGSSRRRPLVDAPAEINKAWRQALAAVPKPDAARLDNQVVQLSLDVDTTLEDSNRASPQHSQAFLPAETQGVNVHPVK